MAEYTAIGPQTVADRNPVLFTDMTVDGGCKVLHRDGSGVFSLIGPNTCPCNAKVVQVTVGANVSIPTGGTSGPISAAISVDGEPDLVSKMTVTPAAVGDQFNISRTISVLVPGRNNTLVSFENLSGVDVVFENVTIDFHDTRR